jgi:hypothetical protein
MFSRVVVVHYRPRALTRATSPAQGAFVNARPAQDLARLRSFAVRAPARLRVLSDAHDGAQVFELLQPVVNDPAGRVTRVEPRLAQSDAVAALRDALLAGEVYLSDLASPSRPCPATTPGSNGGAAHLGAAPRSPHPASELNARRRRRTRRGAQGSFVNTGPPSVFVVVCVAVRGNAAYGSHDGNPA